MAGNLGDIACFSFFSNKNLAIGEGGMITTNRDDLAERLRLLRSHGMTTLTWERHKGHASSYDVVLHGYNYRLDEIHAALGRVQLSKLVENNFRRQNLVAVYKQHLSKQQNWIIPFINHSNGSSYHLMAIITPDQATRLSVVQSLKEVGIQTSLHYPCIYDFSSFQQFDINGIEQSLLFAKRVITLPLFSTLTTQQVEQVCSVINLSIDNLVIEP
jgi:dTDP-4-amino-4,6-dideoxygalactose transaminase